MTSKYDPMIKHIFPNHVRLVLAGDTKSLIRAFPWSQTPEGGEYWLGIYRSGNLPSRARFKLQAMLRAKEKHVGRS